MAIIAVMFGGLAGFIAFLTSLLVFDASFGMACASYMASGFAIASLTIVAAIIPSRPEEPDAQTA